MAAFDVSDSSSISMISQTLLPEACVSIEVSGNYAYAACGSSGLQIINISDPVHPIIIGSFDTSDWVGDVAVLGNYIYVSDRNSGLYILDLSSPANPVQIGHFSYGIYNICIRGDYIFATTLNGLLVINISNPESPQLTGSVLSDGTFEEIAILGNFACIASYNGGLQLVNISDLSHPIISGFYDSPDICFNVSTNDRYVYLSDRSAGLLIIDISEPEEPQLIGSYDTPGAPRGSCIIANTVFLADTYALRRINANNPAQPYQNVEYLTPGSILDAVVSNNIAFVIDNSPAFITLNVSDPANPEVLSRIPFSEVPYKLFYANNKVYVACGFSGLQIVNIDNPESVFVDGSFNPGIASCDVFVSGNYAYLANWGNIQILNIFDSGNPVLVGQSTSLGMIKGITVLGDYAYCAEYHSGRLVLLNISTPQNPVITGIYDDTGTYSDVIIDGNYAFITKFDGWMGCCLSINVSDPQNPTYAGNCQWPGAANGLCKYGNYAAVSCGSGGIRIIDISNPINFGINANYNTPSNSLNAFSANNKIFVSDEDALLILGFPFEGIEDAPTLPSSLSLSSYPNPFNAQTTISYSLSESGPVTLTIYNLLGQKVATLFDGVQTVGEHSIVWNATERPSGVYFAKLETEKHKSTSQMVLLK